LTVHLWRSAAPGTVDARLGGLSSVEPRYLAIVFRNLLTNSARACVWTDPIAAAPSTSSLPSPSPSSPSEAARLVPEFALTLERVAVLGRALGCDPAAPVVQQLFRDLARCTYLDDTRNTTTQTKTLLSPLSDSRDRGRYGTVAWRAMLSQLARDRYATTATTATTTATTTMSDAKSSPMHNPGATEWTKLTDTCVRICATHLSSRIARAPIGVLAFGVLSRVIGLPETVRRVAALGASVAPTLVVVLINEVGRFADTHSLTHSCAR
jgi:hypothetical protein